MWLGEQRAAMNHAMANAQKFVQPGPFFEPVNEKSSRGMMIVSLNGYGLGAASRSIRRKAAIRQTDAFDFAREQASVGIPGIVKCKLNARRAAVDREH